MKNQILGWAVIFAVTVLMSACASHEAQVSKTYKLSGADATMAQPGEPEQALASQGYEAVVSMTLLDERELQLDQREIDLEWREDAAAVSQARLDERKLQLDQKEHDLMWREDTVVISRAWIDEREAQLNQQEGLGSGSEQLAGIASMPTGAEPGRCYARVVVPGEYLTFTDKRLIKPAGTKVEIIPARYETVSEQVLVEKASVQANVIPAEFNYVTDRVMVEPAKKRLVQMPAQYETILEQEMVTPATTAWKKGTGPIQRVDEATGEILCLVETPAQFQTVSKSVLKTPATTHEFTDPPVYETFQRKEITTPARTEMVNVPAQYKTVLVTKMIAPEHEKRIAIPAKYQTVTKRVKVTEDRMDWQEILCKTNMTEGKVSDIQRALAQAGFSPGPIDGIVGEQTMAAVNDFQKVNNLTVAKYLTIDTLVALGPGL